MHTHEVISIAVTSSRDRAKNVHVDNFILNLSLSTSARQSPISQAAPLDQCASGKFGVFAIFKRILDSSKAVIGLPYFSNKKIDENYKANRQYSSLYYQSIILYKKYYTYRGDKVKTIYSQEYEADDFVEPLIDMLGHDKKIALVTTDYDYSRYISDNVHMINKGLDKPYSVKEFEEKFLFKPTKASITLYKALYGDESDNIKGAIYLDKTKLVNNIKELCYNYIKEVADKNKTIEEIISDLDLGRDFDVGNMGETPLEKLLFAFAMNSKQVNIIDRVKLNISIIRSMLEKKDISKYIHSNQEKPEYNSILRQSIFKVDTKTWFGKTK